MRRTIPLCAGILLALVMVSPPASAITDGTQDTVNHYSNVGAVVFIDPIVGWRTGCSGTLLAPGSTTAPAQFLVAGHCTRYLTEFGIPPTDVFVTFDPKLTPTPGFFTLDPSGLTLVPAEAYETAPTLGRLDGLSLPDLGVITLAGPIDAYYPGIEPVSLAPVGFLDQLKPGIVGRSVLSVGYGAEYASPNGNIVWTGWRNFASSSVVAVQPNWLHLLENPNATGQGGTCFGDSGGPQFYQGMQVSVTSWGAARCQAQSMMQRLDLPGVQNWLSKFMRV